MKILKLLVLLFALAPLAAAAQGPTYPYTFTLTWIASTGPTVTGYNVYRGVYTTACPAASAYTKLTTTPLSATTLIYVDSNPPEGSYCYYSTALNGSQESGPSNVSSNVGIPPPPPTGFGDTVAGLNVEFKWKQSTGTGLLANTISCASKPGGLYLTKWVGAPTTKATVKMSAGDSYCVVTATANNQSGASNRVEVEVR
jgi:hypothetical protein